MSKSNFVVGRRKTSIARLKIIKGKGDILVNHKKFKNYFTRKTHHITIMQPLHVTDSLNSYNFMINVKGGGLSGQAGAIRHAISRALLLMNPENRPALKKNGFLTRDSRMVERKKYGRKGARKGFQFSKR